MVSQRTSEIGIRIALGAQTGQVRRMIVSHGGGIALIGVAIGLSGAFGLTRLLDSLLFRVRAIDTTTFVAVAAVMVGVALAASYVPAWRASRVDAMTALRSE
jgi:putative ABC transport system permease protein